MPRTAGFVLGFILAVLQGCTTLTTLPAPPIDKNNTISQIGTVGLAIKQVDPTVGSDINLGHKHEGVGSSILQCIANSGGRGLDAAFQVLICIPVGAVIGGLSGGTSEIDQNKLIATKDTLAHYLNNTEIAKQLHESLQDYSNYLNLKATIVPLSNIYAMADEKIRQDKLPSNIDSLVEISVPEVTIKNFGTHPFKLYFVFTSHIRLIRLKDNQELDGFKYRYTLFIITQDELTEEDDALLNKELKLAYRDIVEQAIDEFMLIYRPEFPIQKKPKKQEYNPVLDPQMGREEYSDSFESFVLTPSYVLQAIFPPVKVKKNIFSFPLTYGAIDPINIDSLSPTIKWEPLPPSMKTTEHVGRITNLHYELRIYNAIINDRTLEANDLIYKINVLSESQHTMEMDLKPCSYYAWTVRAHFDLDGRRRATEWMGAFNAITGSTVHPWFYRRSTFPEARPAWPNKFHYPLFRTPPPGGLGQSCERK
ncbi:MAG: hypothetical protein ABW072_17495 [Sedimenticola sp.]